jgi:hypothetical protein
LKDKELRLLSNEEIVSSIQFNLTPHSSTISMDLYSTENENLIKVSQEYAIPYWENKFTLSDLSDPT